MVDAPIPTVQILPLVERAMNAFQMHLNHTMTHLLAAIRALLGSKLMDTVLSAQELR